MLLYGCVFGGAMKPPGGESGGGYRDFLMPGMFVMTMAFGFMNTATTVVNDAGKGVIDRFRAWRWSGRWCSRRCSCRSRYAGSSA